MSNATPSSVTRRLRLSLKRHYVTNFATKQSLLRNLSSSLRMTAAEHNLASTSVTAHFFRILWTASLTLPDVNVLVYAFDTSSPQHEVCRNWLTTTANAGEPFGLANIILSGYIRVATHPRILNKPASVPAAVAFCDTLLSRPNCVSVNPGPTHFNLFIGLCQAIDAHGNHVTDAYLAALAIEHNCEFVTADKGFARFPGLRWRHPFS